MNWLKENWFKLIVSIALLTFIVIYGYDVYNNHQPKSLDEKIEREILNR